VRLHATKASLLSVEGVQLVGTVDFDMGNIVNWNRHIKMRERVEGGHFPIWQQLGDDGTFGGSFIVSQLLEVVRF
jgi:hypothetical protein